MKQTAITKLLQSVTEVYYKVRQVLQSPSGITKCDSYYEVRRNRVILLFLFFSQKIILLYSNSSQISISVSCGK